MMHPTLTQRRQAQRIRLGAVALALATTGFLGAAGAEEAASSPPATLIVSGEAETTLTPDRASIVAGVATTGDSARDATTENAEQVSRMIAALKEAGIDAADIQTVQFRIDPRYKPQQSSVEPAIAGYEVVNEVAVTIRDIARTGAVLDTLVSAGANRMGQIRFLVGDLDRKLDGARIEAVKDARRKAGLYAEGAGLRLGRILSIAEPGTAAPRPPVPFAAARLEARAIPIEAGSQSTSTRVTVVFELVAPE